MIDCFQHLSLQMFFFGFFHSIIHCFCSTTALVLYIFSSSTAFSLKISQKPSRSFTSCAPVNRSTPSFDPSPPVHSSIMALHLLSMSLVCLHNYCCTSITFTSEIWTHGPSDRFLIQMALFGDHFTLILHFWCVTDRIGKLWIIRMSLGIYKTHAVGTLASRELKSLRLHLQSKWIQI